jgi:HEAT repeat protein
MKRALAFGLLMSLALLPASLAFADDDDDGDGEIAEGSAEIAKKKEKLLASIPSTETVLINVAKKDLPASPDLLNLGKRATKALARCVSDNVDDAVRTSCAILLGRIGDRAALPALQGATEAWNPSVRRAAVGALRSMPDATSIEPLKKLLARDDEDPATKVAAYRTLGALAHQDAVKVLRDALHSPPGGLAMYRDVALEGLWRSRHLMSHATLVDEVKLALKTDDVATIARAERAAAELRAPELVDALIPLMEHADQHVRNRAVWALGRIGSTSATKALLDRVPKVREARMLNNVAFALERLDAKAFYSTIANLVTHKQASIRMNAAFVLGDVRRPEGLAMLQKALSDPNDFVRVSAVSALGKIDAPEAIPSLEPLAKEKNAALREEAIHSIVALSGGKRRELLDELLASKDPGTKLRATLVLAKLGDPKVTNDVLRCVEASTCAVSSVSPYLAASTDAAVPGRLLLAWARGRADLTDLVAGKRPPGAAPIAASDVLVSVAHGELRRAGWAIDLVGDLGDASTIPSISPLLASDKTHLRLHGAVALARLPGAKTDEAEKKLFEDFDLLPVDWLPAAVRAMSRVKEPAARARLTPKLLDREKGSDVPLAMAAAAIRFEWDAESAVFRMLDALASTRPGERELAEKYLLRAKTVLVVPLLRRALARETRDPVRISLRRVLDVRSGGGDAT